MTDNFQKVLIIQDASRELTISMRHVLRNLSLRHGDSIKLLGILQAFRTNSILYPSACISFLKPKKLHSSATINKHKEDIKAEIQKKIEEYLNCAEIKEMLKLTEKFKVQFEIAMEAGLLKEVALEYAKSFQATHVILPGQLRKELKYFTKNLSCGISRMRHDNSIEIIRPSQTADEVGTVSSGTGQDAILNQENCEQRRDIFQDSACSLCMTRRSCVGERRQFTYDELYFATKGFSKHNLLSDHGKKIYIGLLKDQCHILIRENPSVSIKDEDFEIEVTILGKIRHENIAMMIGYCSEGSRRMLVYEYICNGSLNKHLSSKNKNLTWETRLNIAYGAAKGLEILHQESIYGSMRPSNILLSHDYHPVICYYGLAVNQYDALGQSSENSVLKTFEYLAPEYGRTEIDFSKADMFSFGVVLLELITGRKDKEDTDGQSFLRWVRPLLTQKKYMELIDPMLQDTVDLYQLYWMVRVTDKCLSLDPKNRDSVKKVASDLAGIINHSGVEDFSPTESELMTQITE